jgi:PAS domain S-box-containing protein
MQDWDSIQVLSKLAITSEYFLQVTLEESGNVLSSDPGIGPAPIFDSEVKSLRFEDCFLASDWSTYESHRIKALKSSRRSFMVDLQKINHPEGTTVMTKWEFFFITDDFGTCLGLGHPVDPFLSYNLGLGEFLDGSGDSGEVLDMLLESKLLGFWEFDPENKSDYMSNGLAQMLGYQSEDLSDINNIPWQNHIHPEDYPDILKELTQHFHSSGNLSLRKEFRIITKEGLTTWVVGFGKTTRWDSQGHPRKMQGLLIDITEKKKQETWMREHQHFLQDLVFQQSHSLRARVANILGILEILDTEQQTPDSRNLIDILKKESKLLDQCLKKSIKESVSQNESWEREINPGPVTDS